MTTNNNYLSNIDQYLIDMQYDGFFSGELEVYSTSKIFNLAIYAYEYNKINDKYRFLYRLNSNESFQYCMKINHTYMENNCEHYELLKINPIHFNIKLLNKDINNYNKDNRNKINQFKINEEKTYKK